MTSIYCRCFKTAEPISKDYEVSNMLVSIGRDDVKKKEKQLKQVKKYIEKCQIISYRLLTTIIKEPSWVMRKSKNNIKLCNLW